MWIRPLFIFNLPVFIQFSHDSPRVFVATYRHNAGHERLMLLSARLSRYKCYFCTTEIRFGHGETRSEHAIISAKSADLSMAAKDGGPAG